MEDFTTITGVLAAKPFSNSTSLNLSVINLREWDRLCYYSDRRIIAHSDQDTEVTFLMLVAEAENLWDKSE